jgi:REP element-mobilizing transposase RayT
MSESRSGDVGQPPPAVPPAKPARATYRRKLPHIQRERRPVFVTFVTHERWILPEDVRQIVLDHCLHDHGTKLQMHAAVVMPDHVHLLFTPLTDEAGNTYGFAEIMNGIKGASAHSVNRELRRDGAVWQDESFDRTLRSDESTRAAADYICENPVRARLVSEDDTYRWAWHEWSAAA